MSKNLQIPANRATLVVVIVKILLFYAQLVRIQCFYIKTLAFKIVPLAIILISLITCVYNAPITAKSVILLIQCNLVKNVIKDSTLVKNNAIQTAL